MAAAVAEITKLQTENDVFTDEIFKLTSEVEKLTMELSDYRVKQSTSDSSVEEILSRVETIDEMILSRTSMLSDIIAKKEEQEASLKQSREEENETENSISGHELIVSTRREKTEALKAEIDEREMELHRKTSRAKMLDDLEKNMEGYSGSVKAVIKEQRRGALRGIHAPLSQLISVEEQYAVAVETALGASIQHIVTDSENDAKRAISFLKQNRLGRATFLPITSIKSKPFPEENLEDEYGFIDMADKLVTYESQYDEIFIYQLGHIAVAEDMDCAIAIAKKYGYRFRIVTLDGQIINSGGSMTGGSRGHNAGMLSRANEIDRLNEEVAKLTEMQENDKQSYKTMSEDLALAEGTLSAAKADLLRLQEEVIRKESALKLTLSQLETMQNGLSELEEEKKTADTRIEIFRGVSEDSKKKIEELSTRLEEYREKIDSVSKNREQMMVSRDDLGKKEADINLAILALNKDIENKNSSINELRSSVGDGNDRTKQLEEEISSIESKNAEIETNIKSLQEETSQLRNRGSESKKEIETLISRRNECEQENNRLRLEEKSRLEDKEKISGELARLEERKAAIEKEYTDTINKLYDEYQLSRSEAEDIGIVIEDPQQSARNLAEIKNKIRGLGSVNVDAIEEYDEVSQRYEFMKGQIEDIEKSRNELSKLISELTSKMSEQFRAQFAKINSYFGETFAELFNGGKAELVLEDPLDVLECNIDIKVQPPGKNVRNIDLLSGGEKGLSAIALLFAILKVTPAPFCIFDEVEAALDDVNVTRYAQYVRRMTCNTQFILITHRRGTMEEADVLYGVTMQEEGVSKMLELKTAEMAKKLGLA